MFGAERQHCQAEKVLRCHRLPPFAPHLAGMPGVPPDANEGRADGAPEFLLTTTAQALVRQTRRTFREGVFPPDASGRISPDRLALHQEGRSDRALDLFVTTMACGRNCVSICTVPASTEKDLHMASMVGVQSVLNTGGICPIVYAFPVRAVR